MRSYNLSKSSHKAKETWLVVDILTYIIIQKSSTDKTSDIRQPIVKIWQSTAIYFSIVIIEKEILIYRYLYFISSIIVKSDVIP